MLYTCTRRIYIRTVGSRIKRIRTTRSLVFDLRSSIFKLFSPLFPLHSCVSTKVDRGAGIGENRDKERQREMKRRAHDDDVASAR